MLARTSCRKHTASRCHLHLKLTKIGSKGSRNVSLRGRLPGPRLLLLAVSQELKQPHHVFVPYKHRKTNSNSFGPFKRGVWPERIQDFCR